MTAPTRTPGVRRSRLVLVALTAALATLDLGLKAWAERGLANGQSVDLGMIQLRLAFNPGVAFGLGDTLPAEVLITLTGLITAGVAVVAWRSARTAIPPVGLALAVVLAGAIANLIDRTHDGVVTDYLHTGWFPTFNGADILITLGGVALVLATLLTEDHTDAGTEGPRHDLTG